MEPPDRKPEPDLTEALRRWGPSAEFFSLVRALRGDRPALSHHPRDESVRFRADPSLARPSGDISAVRAEAGRFEITQTFLGLAGTVSRLPGFMLEEVLHEDPESGPRRALLDVFHHRAVSLLVAGVDAASPANTIQPQADDEWSERLLALAGAPDTRLSRPELMCILPLVATSRRSASGCIAALRCLLRRRFAIRAEAIQLHELAGRAVPVATSARLALGRRGHALGHDSVVGGHIQDRAARCVLAIGGLDPALRGAFEPDGDGHRIAHETFKLFDTGSTELELELEFVEHGPSFALGHARLGSGSWLGTRRAPRRAKIRDERATAGANAR
jgi:type VI secretion system protein ImpH